MDRLILLRHGKAEADAASGQDFDRVLTGRGRRDVLVVCQAMAEAGLYPDLALVSPAARTVQTWDAAATVFPDTTVRAIPVLYDLGAKGILDLAQEEGGAARTVMIVGHNPGLGALAAQLAARAGAAADVLARVGMTFPTGAAAVIHFEPQAFSLYAPRALRADA
jgi:phosphohistidine phosphatase